MSLAIKYENVKDASMRLAHTVVLYKGDPVYIQDIVAGNGKDDILRVLFEPLPFGGKAAGKGPILHFDDHGNPVRAGDAERKYISSKHFDIGPFKMGYVNSQKGAFYCSRLPARMQKQGLGIENFKAVNNAGVAVGFTTAIGCKDFVDMVHGRYPTFDQAVKALDKSPAVAFHREFCIVRDEVVPDLLWLFHKGQKVGMFNRGEATLGPKFRCLKETLQEMKLKVGVY